jgi:hypothetical protein
MFPESGTHRSYGEMRLHLKVNKDFVVWFQQNLFKIKRNTIRQETGIRKTFEGQYHRTH